MDFGSDSSIAAAAAPGVIQGCKCRGKFSIAINKCLSVAVDKWLSGQQWVVAWGAAVTSPAATVA
jgi:hypothetical protein